MFKSVFDRQNLTALLLRFGLASVFLYAAVSSFIDPKEWVGYMPSMLTDRFPVDVLLKFFSLYEILLATWLLSGVYVRYAALLSAATLAGIVVANPGLLIITFRDVGLIFTALALAVTKEKA